MAKAFLKPAVLAARNRRAGQAGRKAVKIEWFIKEVSDKITLTMKKRVRLATELIRTKVVQNINRPPTRITGPRGGTITIDRSKPGEFPKVDTTLLRDTIFSIVNKTSARVYEGFVGTPLDYGLVLEVSKKLDRSFLKRTLDEERPLVMRLLLGPIK